MIVQQINGKTQIQTLQWMSTCVVSDVQILAEGKSRIIIWYKAEANVGNGLWLSNFINPLVKYCSLIFN